MTSNGDIATIIVGLAVIGGICYFLYKKFRKHLWDFLVAMVHDESLAEKGTIFTFALIYISAENK